MQTFRSGKMRGPGNMPAPEPAIDPDPEEFIVIEDENHLVKEMREAAEYMNYLLEEASKLGLESLFKLKQGDKSTIPVQLLSGIEFERCQKLVMYK